MSLPKLKTLLRDIDDCYLSDRPRLDEVIVPERLEKKVEELREVSDFQTRIRKCRTAGDVFREFSVDAAAAKVDEMKFAKTSSSRQRAQETVLEYALGKAVQRSLSMTLKVSDMQEEELEHEIRTLMGELGFAGSEGASSRLLIGTQGGERPLEIVEVSSSPGSPRELCEVSGSHPVSPGGE